MKILATADLHYNIPRSVEPTRRIAKEICAEGGDALLLVGDTCGQNIAILRECLDLFDAFDGRRMLVAGNHDLWTNGHDSLTRYESEILHVCNEAGFHYLDQEPLTLDHVGFVGSVGWYDYTFRQADLKIPLRFYQAKIAPGGAARLDEFQHLLRNHNDITDDMLAVGARWMDGEHTNLPMSDLDFTILLARKLRRHIEQISPACETIVAAIHHLAFHQLVNRKGVPDWDFANAFMGSEVFGEILAENPRVKHLFCGHSHRVQELQIDHLTICNIGSTYTKKRYKVLDL